ncbi:MAG: hypothetical protein SGBAC_012473 [Bacillariaceae sp.]
MFTNTLMKAWVLATCSFAVAAAEFASIALDGRLTGATLEHMVTLNDPNANGEDTITIKYTVPQECWVAVGVSVDGSAKMVPGEVVLAMPDDGSILKYGMSAYAPDGVTPMESQTLINPNLEQVDGSTILTFTKLLEEDGEFAFVPGTSTTFIAAFGSSNTFGAHVGYGNTTVVLGADTVTSSPEPATVMPTPTTMAPAPVPEEGFKQVPITGKLENATTFFYRVNPADVNGTDTITMEFSCLGNVWIGLGISPTGMMVPSVAAMAQPSGPVTKFDLSAKSQEGVVPSTEQDFIEPLVRFANGYTTLRYTVLADQDEVYPVYSDGTLNTLIGCCGSSEAFGFHQLYDSFTFTVEADPTEAPVASPTDAPEDETTEVDDADSATFLAFGAFVPLLVGLLLSLW